MMITPDTLDCTFSARRRMRPNGAPLRTSQRWRGKFSEGAFEEICNKERTKKEEAIVDSPPFNDIAERATGIIERAGLAAKIQASQLDPNQHIPVDENLWAVQAHWACNPLNCTTTSANAGNKTPYKMRHGSPPDNNPLPLLEPGFYRA